MRNLQNGLPAMGEAAFRRLGSLVGGRYFLGCCYVAVAAAVCYRVLQGTFVHHNSVRLARSYALVHGFDIYPGRDSGALTGIIYGPVGIFSYWPAVFFPSPRSALVCGVLLSIGMSFLPIYLLFRNPRITGDAPRELAGLLFCAVFFHFYWSPADTGVWQIHGDAPAFMLCGLAGYLAVVHGSSRAFSWPLAGSALCAALAPWSKQSYVPIVFVIPVYLLVLGNKRAAVWFLASATGISALLGGLFSAIFGVEDLVLAMFLVPSRHPLNFERLFDAVRMITFGWVGLAMLTVLILVALHSQEGSRPGVSPAVRADWSVWPLFILTGLCMAPTAILGRVKSSGWVNNYGMVDYFLTIGVALCLLRQARQSTFRSHPGLFKGVTAALALVVTVQILRAVPDIALIPTRFVELRDRHYSQQAYAFARQNPGTTYFPWHILASLMADGKLYHTEGGVTQWEDADFPVSEERLRSHLPLNMRYLAFVGRFGARSSERLPEFSCRVEMPELPGWTVLAREGRSCRPND